MLNLEESIIEIKKYLKKLSKTIHDDATLSLIKVKIVNKKKLDDILCCIEASWPDTYKNYLKKNGTRFIKSAGFYQQLLASIRRKFWLSSDSYAVLHVEANNYIALINQSLASDFKKVFSAETDMF